MSFELVCLECSRHLDTSRYRTTCDECDDLLRVEYDTPATVEARVVPGERGIARYLPMLPVQDRANLVTMGEGDTPVVPLIHTGQALGIDAVYAKLEYMNPTGSFKDRGNAVQVSVLKETGVRRAAEIGGGNTGHSLAAYCARAGITFVAFAFEGEDNRKVQAIRQTGAEMHWVDGDRRAAAAAMDAFCTDSDTLNLAYQLNAYFIEGNKTMAYEIAEQMDPLPDNIIIAVGNGSQLLGMWWAFKEMLQDGRVQRIPRLHAVQSEAYQPLASAFQGHDWSPSVPGPETVAIGIKISSPPRLQELVEACRETGGESLAVSDSEIVEWQRRLSSMEGLFVEPTSATVLAAAERLRAQGAITSSESVLFPLTGFGFKEPMP